MNLVSKLFEPVRIDSNSIPPDTLWSPIADDNAYRITKGLGITSYMDWLSNLVGVLINGEKFGDITVEVIDENIMDRFDLSQNYPNPFNPITNIEYYISNERTMISNKVTLKVYDLLGREIKTLVNDYQKVGKYSVKFDAKDLSSGIYLIHLVQGEKSKTIKATLLR